MVIREEKRGTRRLFLDGHEITCESVSVTFSAGELPLVEVVLTPLSLEFIRAVEELPS